MSEVPKIVFGRLQATRPQQEFLAPTHPDADLLSAFAEQSLSPIERENVLGHLSLCGDCRQVIALALPPERTTVPLSAEVQSSEVRGEEVPSEDDCSVAIEYTAPRNSWFGFARPTFGWAALAAGIALAFSLLVLRPIQQKQATLNPPSQPAPVVADGRLETDTRAAGSPQSATVPSQSPGLSTTDEVVPKSPSSRGKAPAHSVYSGSDTLLAGNKYPQDSLMAAKRAPAIEKAKPALQGPESRNEAQTDRAQATISAAAGEAGAASWQVDAGVLLRSYDAGRSWQNVLHADHPFLSVASRDQEIWAGGAAGVLFHSSDGGASWAQVQPADDSETLRSDIIRIDLQSGGDAGGGDLSGLVSRGITVSTSAGDVWNSLDGGKTWKKQ
jgi:hypothetical protein